MLLLYSTNSRDSSVMQDTEIPFALKQNRRRKHPCTLIVVPLDCKDWEKDFELEHKLSQLETATWNARPVLDITPEKGMAGGCEIDPQSRETNARKDVDLSINQVLPGGSSAELAPSIWSARKSRG